MRRRGYMGVGDWVAIGEGRTLPGQVDTSHLPSRRYVGVPARARL